jgi:phosphate starvation-inducible protein PhoH and related proteins
VKRRDDAGAGAGEAVVPLGGVDQRALLGWNDANLRLLEARFDGTITVRGESMTLRGPREQVAAMAAAARRLVDLAASGSGLDAVTVSFVLDEELGGAAAAAPLDDAGGGEALYFAAGSRQAIRPRTPGQRGYVEAIRAHDVVFGLGPAGTGKTYLAVVMAMEYLKRRLVDRVLLVRPAVEAGEQLGFLPGDLQEKIDPYLRPLYDALADTIGPGKISRYMADGVIEAAPLAYMRGRTLSHSFVILDEAQNTTIGQMKMFLTRLGFQSKAVITGDVTQIDLKDKQQSGLVIVQRILAGTEGIAFVEFDGRDVVRHPLVRRIVDAFQIAEERDGGRG